MFRAGNDRYDYETPPSIRTLDEMRVMLQGRLVSLVVQWISYFRDRLVMCSSRG